jgi:hypothetical protein
MWDALTWRGLREPGMADAVAQLRDEALRFLLALSAVAYCVWQFFATTEAPQEAAVRTWSAFPLVALWLKG